MNLDDSSVQLNWAFSYWLILTWCVLFEIEIVGDSKDGNSEQQNISPTTDGIRYHLLAFSYSCVKC